jgi:two-component system, chemotaxis family, sensor kinase Cph1
MSNLDKIHSVEGAPPEPFENPEPEWIRFLDAAIHDLRAPVRGISTFAQILQQTKEKQLDAEANEFLASIRQGATQVDLILKGMGLYSAAVQSRLRAPVKLDLLLKIVLQEIGPGIQESGAVVTSASLPIVLGDRQSLTVLLQNLICNALIYRRPDPPRIHISAEPVGPEIWRISIQDNGLGIGPRYIDQIFQPFKRLYGKEYPGVGLGLAISERIVKNHGGKLWVESVLEEGSTFFFTLPAGESQPRL